MKPVSPYALYAKLGLAVAALAAATGVAFAAWVQNGDDMIVSMFQAGLAWCM